MERKGIGQGGGRRGRVGPGTHILPSRGHAQQPRVQHKCPSSSTRAAAQNLSPTLTLRRTDDSTGGSQTDSSDPRGRSSQRGAQGDRNISAEGRGQRQHG